MGLLGADPSPGFVKLRVCRKGPKSERRQQCVEPTSILTFRSWKNPNGSISIHLKILVFAFKCQQKNYLKSVAIKNEKTKIK